MKKIIFIVLQLFICSIIVAQAPEKINYQAVARNLAGIPLVNQSINVKYEIRQGSSVGTSVYAENHALTTNQFGLFTAEIGGGTPIAGTFAGIAWGTNPFYLYVEVDGAPMGVTQLLSVPYALFAKESGNGPIGAPGKNSLMNITAELAGINCTNGGNKVDGGIDDNADGTLQSLEIDYSYFICNGIDGTQGPMGPQGAQGPQGIQGLSGDTGVAGPQGPAGLNGTNGTTYFPGSGITFLGDTILNIGDNDNDPSNELISLSNLNGTTIEITEAGVLHTIDLSTLVAPTYSAGTGIDITSGTISNTGDLDSTNELQTLSISGDTLHILNGNSVTLPSSTETVTTLQNLGNGMFTYTNEANTSVTFDANINDADADPLNEIQDLSVVGDILTITNNGAATNINLAPYKELPTTAGTGDVLQWNGSAWIAGIDAVNDADSDPTNELELPTSATPGQVLTYVAGSWIAQAPGTGADQWGTQVVIHDTTLTGTGVSGTPLYVNPNIIPTKTSQLTNNSGFITAEVDGSTTNELQTISASGATSPQIDLSNGGGNVKILGAGSTTVSQTGNAITITSASGPTYTQGSGITIAGSLISAKDTSNTNELQTISKAGNIVTLSNAGGSFSVADADSSTTNELQNISFNTAGDSLLITNGAGLKFSAAIPTSGQVLTWNGTKWTAVTPAAGADLWGTQVVIHDATLIGTGIAGTPLSVNGILTDNQNLTNGAKTGNSQTINISGGTSTTFSVADADSSATNELQNISFNTAGDSLLITNGAGLKFSAAIPTSGQVLTWNGTKWTAVTPAAGISTLNGLTGSAQTFVSGTTGTDFNISSVGAIHTFNIPTASAVNRGLLSSIDWTAFNSKGTVSSVSGSGGTTGLSLTGGPITTTGTLTLGGTLSVANGGSGAATFTTGYLKANGTTAFTTVATIPGTDVSGNISGNAANVTGIVPILNGGTNISTLGGNGSVIYSNGTQHASTTVGSPGQVLTSTGAGLPAWTTILGLLPAGTTGQTLRNNAGVWLADTTLYNNGTNIGIGTTTPSQLLTISAPANPIFRFDRSTASAFDWELSAGGLGFQINGGANSTGVGLTNFVTVDGFGKVGIGTTTPNATLQIQKDSVPSIYIKENVPTNGAVLLMESSHQYMLISNASGMFRIQDNTTSTSPFNISPTGFVGIGVPTPQAKLHLHGTLRLDSLSATAPAVGSVLTAMDAQGNAEWKPATVVNAWNLSGNSFTSPASNFIGTQDSADLSFKTFNIERIRISTNGNVAIGTTFSKSKLSVNGDLGLSDGSTVASNNAVTILLTNASAGLSVIGDIVVVGSGNNTFSLSPNPGDYSVLGVVMDAVGNGSVARVAISGVVTVNIGATGVTGGQHCITSSTSGKAGGISIPNAGSSIGVYLTTATPGNTAKVLLR